MDCQPHRVGDHGCLSNCAVRGAYSRFRASDTRVLRSRPPGNVFWHWSAEVSAANSWDFRRRTDQWSGPIVNSGNVTLFGPVDLRPVGSLVLPFKAAFDELTPNAMRLVESKSHGAGCRDSHHRRELCRKRPAYHTTGRQSPRLSTDVRLAETEPAFRPP